jgi:hypothetical protein
MADCILAYKPQQSHLVTCIKTIAENFFDPQGTLVVSLPTDVNLTDPAANFADSGDKLRTQHTDVLSLLLEQLHGTLKRPIIVSGPGREMCKPLPNIIPFSLYPPDFDWIKWNPCLICYDKHNNYILWASGTLRRQLEQLKSYFNAWNARARFLVVLEEIDDLLMVLEEMRQWKILNVAVMIPSRSERNTFELYSWFPYQKPSGECGKLRQAVLINKCVPKNESLQRNASLFPTKIPTDFGGCHITVSTIPLEPHVMFNSDKGQNLNETDVKYTEGLDIRLFKFMAKSMNASVKFLPPPDGDWIYVEGNGTWKGIVGDLIYGRADIGMCATSYFFAFVIDLEFTAPYDTLDSVWVVPRAKQHPRWGSITRVFHLSMWLPLMIVMIVAAGVMRCLSKHAAHREEQSVYGSVSGCLSSAWAAMLGVAVPKQPSTGPMRLVVHCSLCINQ